MAKTKKTFKKNKKTFKKRKGVTKRTPMKSMILRGVGQQMFPDRCFVKVRNAFNQLYTNGANAPIICNGVGGNWFHNNLTGQVSGATAFNITNFVVNPSIVGLNTMIGNPASVNNTGIYNQYRIHGATISVKISEYVTAGTTNIVTIDSYIVPVQCNTLNANLYGNVNTFVPGTFDELQYRKTMLISAALENKALTFSSSMTTKKMFGLKFNSTLEDPSYSGGYQSNPSQANLWAFMVVMIPQTVAGQSVNLYLKFEVVYDVEFYGRNMLPVGQI